MTQPLEGAPTELESGETKEKPTIEDTKPASFEGEEEKPERAISSEDEKVEDKDTVKKIKKRRPKKRPEASEEAPVAMPETAEMEEAPGRVQPEVSRPELTGFRHSNYVTVTDPGVF